MRGISACPRRSPADGAVALADAQLAVTATPATTAILAAGHLHPGLHIIAMGANASHNNEIDPVVWSACDVTVCDSRAQCRERGELRHALAAGTVTDEQAVAGLGVMIVGCATGRTRDDQLTLCDLTGVGVPDTAIARYADRLLAAA